MYWEQIDEKCIFAFLPELETLFAVQSLLMGGKSEEFCREVYGKDMLDNWKHKYRFLFETTDAVRQLQPVGMIEYCADLDIENLTLQDLKSRILEIPAAELLVKQFDWRKYEGITAGMLQEALFDEDSFNRFYDKIEEDCPFYLGVSAFFKQTKRYIRDYFSLAEEMKNNMFLNEIDAYSTDIEEKKKEIITGIEKNGPLGFSQNMLGKTFYNRGPYERFIFLVSAFMPYRCARYYIQDADFHKSVRKQQLLFLSLHPVEKSQDNTIAALKALSDKTRYQILALLSEKGPVHGREIARTLSLAPSTVSHHMDLLRECDLITEEQVRTSKYYGINKIRVSELFEELKKDIKL